MFKQKYFKMILKTGLSFTFILFISQSTFSQVDSSFSHIDLKYKDYMKMIVSGNLEYTAEKFNINIADARIEVAKVFQNPSLSVSWFLPNGNYAIAGYPFYSAGLTKTFELGQKRKARINLAESEKLMSQALLSDFFINLVADATTDYLNALKQSYLYEVMLNSYNVMKKLSDSDSIRLSLGSIMKIDAAQSKIEAGSLQNELIQAETDRNNAYLKLSVNTSSFRHDTLYMPENNFSNLKRSFVLNDLITNALNNRADLQAALYNIEVSENTLILTKKERITDIDLNIGASNYYINNYKDPSVSAISAGISIPLKFSNIRKGDIKIAQFQVQQIELQYKQVEIKIQNEVMQSYNQYNALYRQVESYNDGLLEQAKLVLNGKVYSYSRGETSLLEVLNAQRTYNDLQTSYYQTLYNCYAALVELERAVGICNIDL
jgi:cobalt-zinc-cadmium efflux system outer membrane protein